MDELRSIELSGVLGKKFGKYHKLAVTSAAEAVRALSITIPGFRKFLENESNKNIEYAVFVGKQNIKEDELQNNSSKPIKIVPLVAGSKQGVLQTIIGVILIIVSFIPGMQGLFPVGVAMTLGGVVQMLTPQASTKSGDGANNGTSYEFNGPVNTSAQGVPVPLLYGEALVGGAVISGGIEAIDQ